ncbi:MAG: prmC 3 [Marmoricola sp.]|nr:prmC 3 [Marmoricola sp.]
MTDVSRSSSLPRRGDLLAQATAALAAAGVPSPANDAEVLLAHALGTPRARLLLVDEVDATAAARLASLVERRAQRIPLQHLIGSTGFRYLDIEVGPGVFTPRPETELLAGWAIEAATGAAAPGRDVRVVDLCTGSGAIAASVARELPHCEVYAVELDPAAVSWAERNLLNSGVELRHGDMADAFPELDGTVDVVVCNPPYVPLTEYEGVDVEAREHDPALALFSGEDGLDAMRVLEQVAARLLRAGGVVGAEHADLQGESAPAVFAGSGRWSEVRDHRDLAGRPRYLTARLAR